MPDLDDLQDVDRLLKQADRALESGGALELIDELVRYERTRPDPRVQRALVELRHAAFAELDRNPGRTSWPPSFEDPFPGRTDLVEVAPGELSAEVLGGALVHHGCLRVDGLISREEAARFAELIEQAFQAREEVLAGAPPESAAPLFVPFAPGQAKADGFGSAAFLRAVDMPGALSELTAVFDRSGVARSVTGYFNERPAMIANKWVLRRTPSGKIGTDFHQDGAFLGDDIRTVDCWISLSDCGPGTGRPAVELVPRRFDSILPSSDESAFNWSITEESVRIAAAGSEVVSPVFAPGDALFFDERLPHRTSVGLDLTVRYAIESWFVAPSSYPAKHVPVVL